MAALRGVVIALVVVVSVVTVRAQTPVPPPLKSAAAPHHGTILTGPGGMTLYTFATDKGDGRSLCTGACARKWPPFAPAGAAPEPSGALSTLTREDGTRQYAWKGKPLYYYADDTRPGEAKGHGVGQAWFVAKP